MRAAISIASTAKNHDLAHIARAFVTAEEHGGRKQAVDHAERSGASPRALSVLKSAVAAGTTSNWGALTNDTDDGVVGAFIESLSATSILAYALSNGATRAPAQSRAVVVTNAASGSVVSEGSVTPVTSLGLNSTPIPPKKAVSLIVISKELMLSNVAILDAELRKATARAADAELLSEAQAGGSTSASVGTSDEAAKIDLATLLAAVNIAGSSLVLAMAPDVANRAALIDDGRGLMSPSGGIWFGIQTIVTDACTAGTMTLIDVTGLVGGIESFEIVSSGNGAVQMETVPDSPPTASTVTLSLWQSNLVGLNATLWFGIEKHRAAASATITDIAWSVSPDSPA
ncbi:phage major capsid protein [Mesorhizobium sp. M00.F.Ca.ET.217.01.1.1]|uniref:phage major capsid protein n=1 Tax=Mesorhizobium sp. M00.F.Ca.ET.217.01.1.1 TaxID=2500529 RepID=UPI000FDAEE71|nr:phage major capsid protein [Mesorhizobium sp. M00.F.Ca.ET.217.01.1.1]TGQ15920.1 hypothetical protein EN860_025545 [Mesorhizobium sp. M00.F.Ca.ET.217.01.1.1]TGV87141.1 hypothetical protein EN801_026485 [Mesorhizobium sp. M00.F.Ca.ET.158.01.1.1]